MQHIIAGIDEAGRGPLAGPVYAGCVILDPKRPIAGLKDSKQLTAKQRDHLFDEIIEHALCWSVAFAEVEEIDRINIFQASLLAMQRSYKALKIKPHIVLVDGRDVPNIPGPIRAEIQGDERIAEISAASIIAKVSRDRYMTLLDKEFPHYGFAKHKGYSTKEHLAALKKYGPSLHHRRSFMPVKNCFAAEITYET